MNTMEKFYIFGGSYAFIFRVWRSKEKVFWSGKQKKETKCPKEKEVLNHRVSDLARWKNYNQNKEVICVNCKRNFSDYVQGEKLL
jgi:hypothetical protein